MEISSDHGHNGADDEIDIDIDLTASYEDDDYMLEDTVPNVAFGDNLITQRSPAAHDDLMIDGYPEIYTMEDEDVEFGGDDHQMDADTNIVQEAMADAPTELDGSNIAESNMAESNIVETNTDLSGDQDIQIAPNNSAEVVETVWHQQETPETATGANDADDGSKDTASHDVDTSDIEEPVRPVSKHKDPSPTLQDKTSPASIDKVPSLSPGPDSEHDAENLNGHVPEQLDAANDHDREEDARTANENGDEAASADNPVTTPDVVVIYQSVEYSLFSKSEDDNPDSFFLSDLKVLESSLGVFFEEIRNVIHGDLADEDELCLSVEDLGLDIEEVRLPLDCKDSSQLTTMEQNSTLLQEHTLGDIISVYRKLLSNEDGQPSRPLYMSIGARPNFSKRLVVLTASAAEGKGLSEMISFDDGSDGIDDLEAATQDVEAYEATTESTDHEELHIQRGKNIEKTIPESEDTTLPTSRTSPPISGPESPGRRVSLDVGRDNIGSDTHEELDQGLATSTLDHTNPRLSPDDYLDASGKHDEEDLIDYSDEEYQVIATEKGVEHRRASPPADQNEAHNGTSTDLFSPCLKPSTYFCTKCTLLLAEYEEINEKLRRRSVSAAASERELEISPKPSPPKTKNRQEPHDNVEDEAGGEGEAEEVSDGRSVQSRDKDLTAANIDAGSVQEEYQDESPTYDDSEDGELAAEYGIAIGPDGGDAEDAVYQDEHGHQNLEDEIEIYGEDHELPRASSGVEPGDIANSSATLSVDEPRLDDDLEQYGDDELKPVEQVHELHEVSNNEVGDEKDEIDYEDGEDNEEQSSTKPDVPPPTVAGGGLKRPLSDVETEGAMTSKGTL